MIRFYWCYRRIFTNIDTPHSIQDMISENSSSRWMMDYNRMRVLYPDISLEFKEDLVGNDSFSNEISYSSSASSVLLYINDNSVSQIKQVGSITMKGGGSGLLHDLNQDYFYFVHHNAVSSNFEMEVYLEYHDYTNDAGFHFMVRESVSPDSKYISVSKMPNGVRVSFRSEPGEATVYDTVGQQLEGGCWLKIHRIGDIFETYYKVNESNDYIGYFGRQMISMKSSVLIGFGVSGTNVGFGVSGTNEPPPSFTFSHFLYSSEPVSQTTLR